MIRFKFIEDHRTEFSIKRMCTVLKVRRSSYYKWASNATRREQQVYADGLLGERIRIAFEAEGGLYGAKRIAALLTAQTSDQPVNHKRVARVMKALGLAGFTKNVVSALLSVIRIGGSLMIFSGVISPRPDLTRSLSGTLHIFPLPGRRICIWLL